MTTGGRSQPVTLATRLASESQQHSGRLEENGPRQEQSVFLFLSYSLAIYIIHLLTFLFFCFGSD